MKQKTAMMELIELLEDFVKELDSKYDGDPWVKRGVFISINEAKDRLQKEKEQIMDAYIDGEQAQGYEDEANLYYNQTYLEESNEKI